MGEFFGIAVSEDDDAVIASLKNHHSNLESFFLQLSFS